MAARSRRSIARPQRRKLVWARVYNTGQTHVPAVDVTAIDPLAVFTSALGAVPIGVTVMGIRGNVMWALDDSAVDGDRATFRWGIRVKSDTDTTAGDFFGGGANNDWMAFDGATVYAANALTAGQADGTSFYRREVNVRSRRRLEEMGDTLALCSQVANASTTSAVFFYDLSILLALP